jgi:hypothetical protein
MEIPSRKLRNRCTHSYNLTDSRTLGLEHIGNAGFCYAFFVETHKMKAERIFHLRNYLTNSDEILYEGSMLAVATGSSEIEFNFVLYRPSMNSTFLKLINFLINVSLKRIGADHKYNFIWNTSIPYGEYFNECVQNLFSTVCSVIGGPVYIHSG